MADEITFESAEAAAEYAKALESAAEATKRLEDSTKSYANVQKETIGATNDKTASVLKTTEAEKKLLTSTKEVTNATLASTNAAKNSADQLNVFHDIAAASSGVLKGFGNSINSVGDSLKSFERINNDSYKALSILSATVLGVKESFNSLGGNINTDNLVSFKNETNTILNDINSALNSGPLSAGLGAISKIFGKDLAGSAERNIGGVIKQSGRDSIEAKGALMNYMSGIITAVDNVRKLTNVQVQLAAATGNLSVLYDNAGDGLLNFNNIADKEQAMLKNLGVAYGISSEVLEQYYTAIGKIPGALSQNVIGYDASTSSISALNGAMLLASGSGRSFSDVTKDLHDAVRNYNADQDQALTYVSRLTEITNSYGLELEDVRSLLGKTSSDFKFFGNAAEGAASMVNAYVRSIKDTGVSGSVALEIVGQMTNGVKQLTLAQKSFLSAQTGGPGGLMGGFQIEKDLRDGKIDKVFEKVRETMKKQMGSIVSLDEAAMSPEAAAKFTKQMQILKSGPLGSFAGDDQSAMRILEGFKKLESGESIAKNLTAGKGEGSERGRLMEIGNTLLQRNNDAVTQLNRHLERQTQLAQLGAAEFAGGMLGGAQIEESSSAGEMERFRLNKDIVSDAIEQVSKKSGVYDEGSATNDSADRMQEVTKSNIKFVTDMIEATGKSITGTVGRISEGVKENLSYKNPLLIGNEQYNAVENTAEKQGIKKEDLNNLIVMAQNGNKESLSTLTNLIEQSSELNSKSGLTNKDSSLLGVGMPTSVVDIDNSTMFKQKLPSINPENLLDKQNLNDEMINKNLMQKTVNQNQSVNNGMLKVHIEGICIECNKKMNSDHFTAIPSTKGQ